MRLQAGMKAMNFNVKDVEGNQINFFEDYKEKKVLLSFYRYAACPLCNLRVHQLIQKYDEFSDKGLHVLAFFHSPEEKIKKNVGRQNTSFPIIPDPEMKIYKLYNVEKSWLKYIRGGFTMAMVKAILKGFFIKRSDVQRHTVPADFLIDDLVIKNAYYGTDISKHIPFEEIELFLQ